MAQQYSGKRTIRESRNSRNSSNGKLQPQAVELEEAVLGALMVEQQAIAEVSEILSPESFYKHSHQLIYKAIRELTETQSPIDFLTVKNQLEKNDDLERVGGLPYLMELTRNIANSAHIEYHANIIAQKALARQLITFTSEVQQDAFDEGSDISELMQRAEGELFKISQRNLQKDYTQIDPVIKEAQILLREAQSRDGHMSGLTSGFDKLDEMTHGWQKSDLVIIAARPAMGKTAFVLSMAKNMAVDHNIPVAIFSLEMSNVQLVNRLLVNVSQVEGDKIKSGNLNSQDAENFAMGVHTLQGKPIYVDDTPSLSVFELRTKARRLVKEHGIEMIIIDYLQLMNASGMKHGSRQEEVSTISRSLKGLAKELNIPVIALSQLNRGVESREGPDGKKPQLSDLRESGAIEQDADMVCFIHRPEYYKIKEVNGISTAGRAMIIIAKHRNGSVGDVMLEFKKDFAKFDNIDDTSLENIRMEEYETGAGASDGIYQSRLNHNYGSIPPPESNLQSSEEYNIPDFAAGLPDTYGSMPPPPSMDEGQPF
ncbi:MAG TPA: replicative DNA helicase [Bacteroidaceae bacterium]|nr:replicative DNA helicase [Bacteroidaceae bacterium]